MRNGSGSFSWIRVRATLAVCLDVPVRRELHYDVDEESPGHDRGGAKLPFKDCFNQPARGKGRNAHHEKSVSVSSD